MWRLQYRHCAGTWFDVGLGDITSRSSALRHSDFLKRVYRRLRVTERMKKRWVIVARWKDGELQKNIKPFAMRRMARLET